MLPHGFYVNFRSKLCVRSYRKREERLRRVVEAQTKEEEEKKKRIELKMSQKDGKNKKVCNVIAMYCTLLRILE